VSTSGTEDVGATSRQPSDREVLHQFGYAQQLLRDMGGFSNFAISFSIISILTGAVTLYGVGLTAGGPVVMGLGWPLVTLFVLCIAVGSLAVSALSRIHPRTIVLTQWALVALLVVLYLEAENAPYAAHVLRTFFRDREEALLAYSLASFAAILAVLALPIALSGASLPLLFHHLRREVGQHVRLELGDQCRRLGVADVELVEGCARGDVLALARDEIVDDVDGPSFAKEPFDEMRADEARPARDDDGRHQRASPESTSSTSSAADVDACSSSAKR